MNIYDKLLRYLRIKRVIKEINLCEQILDIGCDYDCYFLNKIEDKILVKGFGIDQKEILFKGTDKIYPIQYKIVKTIPFPDSFFDIVTMIAVIEHIEYPDDVLKECYRILKKGGKLVITTPSLKAKIILDFLTSVKIITPDGVDHKTLFSPVIFCQKAKSCNFHISKITFFELGFNVLYVFTK